MLPLLLISMSMQAPGMSMASPDLLELRSPFRLSREEEIGQSRSARSSALNDSRKRRSRAIAPTPVNPDLNGLSATLSLNGNVFVGPRTRSDEQDREKTRLATARKKDEVKSRNQLYNDARAADGRLGVRLGDDVTYRIGGNQ